MGLVLNDWVIVELPNHSKTPAVSFMVSQADIAPYKSQVIGTWHTHPRNNVNLSATDYLAFLTMPEWTHYVVAESRVRSFVIRNNKVMLHEADCF